MVSPDYYDVVYQINDHMNLDYKVDKALAKSQWDSVRQAYEDLGFEVIVAPGDEMFPDMVFSANQIFTAPEKIFFSNMKHSQREGEVDYLKNYLQIKNSIQINAYFESMGDCLWDYEGERIFGGYGFRTDNSAYDEIRNHIDNEIIEIELINSNFYHLDTCLCIVNSETAFYVACAFSVKTIEVLKRSFSSLIEVDSMEATKFIACNAHCPDGKTILVEEGAIKLQKSCQKIGLRVIPINTSEFLKSGGSIFCMKNQGWF